MTLSFLVATVIFTVSLALGMRVAPDVSIEMLQELGQLLEPLESLGSLAILLVIFLNNAIKTLGVVVLGVIFGLPALVFVSFNGFMIGTLVSGLKSIAGYGVIAASMAPHGVIEVPVLLLATALGFSVGGESLKWLIGRRSSVRAQLLRGLKFYFKWILGGLLVASVIEVFATPLIVGLAGG